MMRLLIAGLILLPRPAQDPQHTFELKRHIWLKWKPGTYSMHKLSFTGPQDPPPDMTITRRLESSREKEYTLSETQHSLGFADRNNFLVGFPSFVQEETLDLPSGKRACTVWEWEASAKGSVNKGRFWLGTDHRPLQFRWIHSREGAEQWRQEVKAVAFDEEVSVAGKVFRCVRLEGTYSGEGRNTSCVEWWTDEVPGGSIRAEMTFDKGPPIQKLTIELVSFGSSDPAQPPPGPPRKAGDLALTPGMDLDKALTLLEASGAWEFECGYARGVSPAKPRSFLVSRYFTLRNGLTLRFDADKEPWLSAVRGLADWPPHYAQAVDCPECKAPKDKACPVPNGVPHDARQDAARTAGLPKDDPAVKRKLLSLGVCNSTMLLCCKGETWYPIEAVDLKGERVEVTRLPATVILKGMKSKEAEAAAGKAKSEKLETDAAWLKAMPKQGQWFRFALPNNAELILNVGTDDTVALIVLQNAEGDRVEAELVDVAKPLGERGFGAFGERWSWKPDRPPEEAERLKRSGHRR